jgi:hypothetical protein
MVDRSEYCREIETYLCRKNEGHLIRIVGPAFEQVCGWAERGVPLKIAFRGIDRYCERYYSKGPRRRPVRVEFCEADVLDSFDEWRRAVGVTVSGQGGDGDLDPVPRKPALAAHIERVIARLTALRAGGQRSAAFDVRLAGAVRELDHLLSDAKRARGEARADIIARLGALDRTLVTAALDEIDAVQAESLKREAETELAPFAARMAPVERGRAADSAFRRLVRETVGLPIVRYE